MVAELAWWQCAVIYEIAPVSFQDSDGDGNGDLRGLLSRIDYLTWLGIDAVWLTPVYPSPMLDLGYDISEYCDIDPIFGTLDQFDELLNVLHKSGIRVSLDIVPNRTSDQHRWFAESRSSRHNPKRDWYIWADRAANGGPPNDWLSRFGGTAWEWDQATGQYYYHSFLLQQPDLNWRNPEVRHAMAEVLRFWLRRRLDGFRVDASAVLSKDALLRDNPPDPSAGESKPPPQRLRAVFNDDRPEAMGYLAGLRAVVDEFDNRALLGEVQGKSDRIGHFYGGKQPRLHLPLNFALLDGQWDAVALQATVDTYLNAIPDGAWPNWVIGGHDKRRVATSIGQQQARVLAVLPFTLRGTPIFFAGDELGMECIAIPADRVKDPFEKLVPGYGLNRDPQRVPMRWTPDKNAGFSKGEPWLPVGPDVTNRNVLALANDSRSILWLYKRLIELRRTEPSLIRGSYVPMRSHNDIFLFKRVCESEEVLIALNVTREPRQIEWQGQGTLLLSSYLDDCRPKNVRGPIQLRPSEGLIIKISS